MQDPTLNEIIERNRALARELGINGTPGFIVGTDLVPGAIELKDLQNLVDQVRQRRVDGAGTWQKFFRRNQGKLSHTPKSRLTMNMVLGEGIFQDDSNTV